MRGIAGSKLKKMGPGSHFFPCVKTVGGRGAVSVKTCRAVGASNIGGQELHGMFDHLDHSKVVRNDTQEQCCLALGRAPALTLQFLPTAILAHFWFGMVGTLNGFVALSGSRGAFAFPSVVA